MALKWIETGDLDHEFMSELDKHGRMWKQNEWIDDEEEKVRRNSIMIGGRAVHAL